MKKRLKIVVLIVCLLLAVGIQLARQANTYPVSLALFGDGISHTLYIASCEPYSTYMEYHDRPNWMYLHQAPADDGFDPQVELLIYTITAGSETYMDKSYRVETFRTSEYGVSILSFDTLAGSEFPYIQKSLNKLAHLTSMEQPLYLTWSGDNLYGVVNDTAYLLFYGGSFALSIPEIYDAGHVPTVVALGPITQDDYEVTPATPS